MWNFMDSKFQYFLMYRSGRKLDVFSLLACGCFIFGSRNGMYIGVTGLEFFFTLCSMLIYLTGLDKKITFFYWILIDLLNTMLTTVFLFIVSIIAIISKMNLATTVGGASLY
uniref:Chemokine-like factor isoform X3 n=1 Tax=Geotrypetes seraphini TaxID=260995 RepID=A0A6P8QLE0_GEOSA|nr:chemokine-like factor isoform X3 [Geotrypetes seraphini]